MRATPFAGLLLASLLSLGCAGGSAQPDALDDGAADTAEAACSPACDNGGACVSSACECAAGYAGAHCSSFVGPCAPDICQDGGACVTTATGYRCECAGAFGAADCTTHALDVALSAPDLAGVGDLVWDVELVDGKADVVWQRRVTASAFGDGDGSASVAGVCGANPDGTTSELHV